MTSIHEPDFLPGLSILHGNHLEDLREVAVSWLRQHPSAPLANETFIVQSNGMAQWLKLALADDHVGCGIAAGLSFLLPGRFVWQMYRSVLGGAVVPEVSPYDRYRLVWRLMGLLPGLAGDECFDVLGGFLSKDPTGRKQFQLSCRLAALYDQYQVYRSDWLAEWERGRDHITGSDGRTYPLPPAQLWQPALWRRIRKRIPEEERHTDRAGLHRRFLDAVQDTGLSWQPPSARYIVFGISSLPVQVLETLHEVSRRSQVLVFVLNPCRYYWGDIIEDRELLDITSPRHRRPDRLPETPHPDTLHQYANPLLAAWGKQGRDFIGLLYGYDLPERYQEQFSQIDLFRDRVSSGDGPEYASLLNQVQQAILDLVPLPASSSDRTVILADDRSIQFHETHSRRREVEVLQDRLLDLFERLPDISPKDVVVMMPDIEVYAPHVQAVFGNIPPEDPRHLPFSIADGSDALSKPLLGALEFLLSLPGLRMTSVEIPDLLDLPCVAGRFGIDRSDLPRIRQWIQESGVCWGLSPDHRAGFDLPGGFTSHTWAFGLDRMMAGYVMGSAVWEGIEPYDEVGGLDAALAGGLYDLVSALDETWKTTSRPASPETWCRRIRSVYTRFFEPQNSRERLFVSRIETALTEWETACSQGGFSDPVPLTVVREHLLSELEEVSTSQRFLAGRINFGTLMPMRAIPFKVVCLLGMNDGEYPRSQVPMDFDLMSGPGGHRPGDRSCREDDRYLFLEAVLSARQALVISHIARDARDNSLKAPSVLVAQFREYLDNGWCPAPEPDRTPSSGDRSGHIPVENLNVWQEISDRLTCRHPLQPFSPRYFHAQTDSIAKNCLFTYAHEWQAGDAVIHSGGSASDPFGETPLPAPVFEPDVKTVAASGRSGDGLSANAMLSLVSLERFMRDPVAFFFLERLKVNLKPVETIPSETEPFDLEPLPRYLHRSRLIRAALSAPPGERESAITSEAEHLAGTGELPAAGFTAITRENLVRDTVSMTARIAPIIDFWRHPLPMLELDLTIPSGPLEGTRIVSVLEGVFTDPDTFSRHKTDLETASGSVYPVSSILSHKDRVPLARWSWYPGDVGNGVKTPWRIKAFIPLWIGHLAGCAAGLELTSYLFADTGIFKLAPLSPIPAQERVHDIVRLWGEGLRSPLPVTPKTASTWLCALAKEKRGRESTAGPMDSAVIQSAFSKVRLSFEGNDFIPGECSENPFLYRAYPTFEAFRQARESGFPELAERLYGPPAECISRTEGV